MAGYTKRFIIVASAATAAAANTAANQNDTNDGGDGAQTFTVGLSVTGLPPATAYWCSWALRPAQAVAIRTRLQQQGATVAETTPLPLGGTLVSTRFVVFDASDGWSAETVLAKLGLKRVEVAP